MPEHKNQKVKSTTTRLQMLERRGETPRMPEITRGGYMMEAMKRLVPVRQLDMGGYRPVDWTDILDFSQGTQRVSEPWEIELLYDMAQAYFSGYCDGCSPFSVEPMEEAYPTQMTDAEVKEAQKSYERFFDRLMGVES